MRLKSVTIENERTGQMVNADFDQVTGEYVVLSDVDVVVGDVIAPGNGTRWRVSRVEQGAFLTRLGVTYVAIALEEST